MVKASHHVSLFTLSRLDLYDYIRCPKIVSIKVHRLMTEPVREPAPKREVPEEGLTPQIIGKVGEVATKVSLSQEVPEQRKELTVVQLLRAMGIAIDGNLRRLLAESLAGLDVIKPKLEKEYGQIEIIGRGETRYGASPTYGKPDFVAVAKGKEKPILVEVKNSQRPASQDTFQAAYYNTMQSTVGVTVMEDRLEDNRTMFVPRTIVEKDAETIIIYPRLADSVAVRDTVEMGKKLIKGIWEAKQLGLMGQSPETCCGSKCPHLRYQITLPESSLEPARPLALIYGKGLEEKGYDPTTECLRHFAWQKASPLMMLRWQIEGRPDGAIMRVKIAKLLAEKTGLPLQVALKIVVPDKRQLPPYPEEIHRQMASEFEPWERLIKKKEVGSVVGKAGAMATRIYALPNDSSRFVDDSWAKW